MEYVNLFEQTLAIDVATELWQNPHDDRQFTIIPARMTSLKGALGHLYTLVGHYSLPTTNKRYVVYMSGQSSPDVLGIDHRIDIWTRMDKLVKKEAMIVHAHIKQRQLPLSAVYVVRANNKNLLYALDVDMVRAFLLEDEPLMVHYYSNNVLTTLADTTNAVVEYSGKITMLQQAADILTKREAITGGNVYLHHNGYYVDTLTVSEIKLNDTLALLHDASGRGYFDVEINNLKHFTSTIDSRGKLIVQVPDELSDSPLNVEPCDEVEIYICNRGVNSLGLTRTVGVYYSRVSPTDIRMVTHRDFAVDSNRVDALVDEHRDALNGGMQPFFRVFLRNHDLAINTTMDSLFLHDLFRVNAENRLYLMTDAAGTYQAWKAEALEESIINRIHMTSAGDTSLDELKGIYSLPELNARLRTAVKKSDHFILPQVMDLGGKVLCFNANGELVNVVDVVKNMGNRPVFLPANVTAIECIPGTFTESGANMDRNTPFIGQASYYNEKYYYANLETMGWTEAKEGVDYDININTGKLVWRDIHDESGRMRRTIEDAIYRRIVLEPEEMHHPIDIYTSPGPATLLRLSRIDLFINGRRATEGVDYLVNYPKITITNKEFYKNSDADVVLPRFGFVRHRLLRDTDPDVFFENRNTSLFIDGYRAELTDANLTESPNRTTAVWVREGGLYCAEPWPHCIGPWGRKRLFDGNYEAEIEASGSVSKLIPQPDPQGPVFIPYGHSIYSPMIKRLLLRLRSGEIDVDVLGLSDVGVAMVMRNYAEELQNDILSTDLDFTMLDVHPTPNIQQVDVTETELLFLRAVNRLYLQDRVVFNTYVNVQDDIEPHT